MKIALDRFNENERNALLTQAVYTISSFLNVIFATRWGLGVSFSPGKQKLLSACSAVFKCSAHSIHGLHHYLDNQGRCLCFGPWKRNFRLDYPESYLSFLFHFAVECLVSECLVNITVKAVLSDLPPDFCILLLSGQRSRGAWQEPEAEHLIPATE